MSTLQDGSVGQLDFVTRHGLMSEEQLAAIPRIKALIEQHRLRTIRIAWCDQHGLVRGKHVMVHDFLLALRNGVDFQTATLFMDTTNNMVAPLFAKQAGGIGVASLCGGPDAILVPDPLTFRVLPWAERTGWILSEMHLNTGEPVPFDTRALFKRSLAKLHQRGLDWVGGLEVEFYICKLEDRMLLPEQSGWPPDPPKVSAIAHGFQYLTEERQDEIDPILQMLHDNLEALDLPLRTMEDEWGPGQCEFTFDPTRGVMSADHMVLFRTAVKQLCRRHGYHATFMTRPALPNFFSSGWHLHQSICSLATGENMFANMIEPTAPLSLLGRQYVAGLLAHAAPACVFSTPTINGYKRFRPNSFAPDHVTWASENRAAMIRVLGGPGDRASHIENRTGEPCANPYLYMASQIVAGLDGVDRQLDPGPMDETPYESNKPKLPQSLMDATVALAGSQVFRAGFGDAFVDYMLLVKQNEINRFLQHVTDWEHREYFEMY
ncbi:MAG: glutamine synthetase [Gammaproteobacteria bacterium]|nr:glutamine synthetase [Gammaproteobacteria bacterium]